MKQATDITGWKIYLTGGTDYIGKPTGMGTASPIYQLVTQVQMQPAGPGRMNIQVMRQAFPVLWFSSIESLAEPKGMTVLVADLSKKEQEELLRAVQQCEVLLTNSRAQDAGIVIATEIPRVQ